MEIQAKAKITLTLDEVETENVLSSFTYEDQLMDHIRKFISTKIGDLLRGSYQIRIHRVTFMNSKIKASGWITMPGIKAAPRVV